MTSKIKEIEAKYGKDCGIKDSKELGEYLEKAGYKSLRELLRI